MASTLKCHSPEKQIKMDNLCPMGGDSEHKTTKPNSLSEIVSQNRKRMTPGQLKNYNVYRLNDSILLTLISYFYRKANKLYVEFLYVFVC